MGNPQIPPETDVAVYAWMRSHGWQVATTRWQMDPETGFHIWEEETLQLGRSHALWVAETMVGHLKAEELVEVLNRESVAEYIRISFKVRIEERGAGYRVPIVPRRSGEFKREE